MKKPEQNYHPVLYTTPNCQPCRMTKRWFDQKNIAFQHTYYDNEDETNEVDVKSTDPKKQKWSEQKIEKIKQTYEGITSFPIVKVINDQDELLDVWCGYRPDKLNQWFKQ